MRWLAVPLAVFSATGQNARKPPAFKILLVEGQGAINVVNRRVDRQLTIRVEETYGAPGKAIPVTFTLPASGPGGSFKKGAQSVTITTDDDGYAVARGYRPNKIAGQYSIRVSASTPGGTITASIPQTNAAATAGDHGRLSRKLIFTVLAAAAAGAGAIMALAGN
jgi:hypothetical protein